MLTIKTLQEFGADVQDGLERCLNEEDFYLELVNMALDDDCFDQLAAAIEAGDKKTAFSAAHALKGVLANVSLTPLSTLVSEVTELLREDKDADYPAYLDRILSLRNQLLDLRNSA